MHRDGHQTPGVRAHRLIIAVYFTAINNVITERLSSTTTKNDKNYLLQYFVSMQAVVVEVEAYKKKMEKLNVGAVVVPYKLSQLTVTRIVPS